MIGNHFNNLMTGGSKVNKKNAFQLITFRPVILVMINRLARATDNFKENVIQNGAPYLPLSSEAVN